MNPLPQPPRPAKSQATRPSRVALTRIGDSVAHPTPSQHQRPPSRLADQRPRPCPRFRGRVVTGPGRRGRHSLRAEVRRCSTFNFSVHQTDNQQPAPAPTHTKPITAPIPSPQNSHLCQTHTVSFAHKQSSHQHSRQHTSPFRTNPSQFPPSDLSSPS